MRYRVIDLTEIELPRAVQVAIGNMPKDSRERLMQAAREGRLISGCFAAWKDGPLATITPPPASLDNTRVCVGMACVPKDYFRSYPEHSYTTAIAVHAQLPRWQVKWLTQEWDAFVSEVGIETATAAVIEYGRRFSHQQDS